MKRRKQTRRCKPARGRCTSAKDGGAIAKNSPCKGCGQWRCRTHCACAGTSNAKGRCGPRPRRSAKATAKLVPSAFVPQGRPAPDSYEVFDDESWQVRALQEIGACSDVVLSSYMFDDTGIQEALLSRLRKNPLTVVRVVVVADSFQKGTCRGQRKMLHQLRDAGAKVYLGKGRVIAKGCHHKKALILDNRVAYAGGSNWTMHSRRNEELVFRFLGTGVRAITTKVVKVFAKRTTRQLPTV